MTSLAPPRPSVRTVTRAPSAVVLAWIGTLALSHLPTVVLVETLGVDPAVMRWPWLAIGCALVVAATAWRPARPLRGYFITMLVVVAATSFVMPLLTGWTRILEGSAVVQALAVKFVFFLVALGVAVFLVRVLGQRRGDVFLTLGDLKAPAGGHLPGTRRSLNWAVIGTFSTLVLSVGFATQLWMEGAFPAEGTARLPGLALVVLAAACCNAFGEEVIFRAGPLGFLQRVVGPGQAVLMTSVWFGLGHYYGSVPSGPIGAVQSGMLALLLGSAMVKTKGLGWPLIIHVAMDVVVFASIAAAV